MNDLLIVLLRTIGGYGFLIIMMKLMGKREIGQLSLFDLLIVLSIADVMVISIENFDRTILYSIIPVLALALSQKTIAFLSLKFVWIRKIFDGSSSIIIEKGVIQLKEMRKQNYNMDDLLSQLRQKNISDINDVEFAILETGGRLSVFRKKEIENGPFLLPIIVSGKIEKDNLKLINKDELWVKEQISRKGLKMSNIYCGYFQNNDIIICKVSN